LGTRKRVVPYSGYKASKLTQYTKLVTGPERIDLQYKSPGSASFSNLDGTQITVSENHPEWKLLRNHPGIFLGNVGGGFDSRRRYVVGVPSRPYRISGIQFDDEFHRSYTRVEYEGPVLPQAPSDFQFPPYADSSDGDLREWGRKAIALSSPVNPAANVSTFLGEFLSEGLPHSVGSALKHIQTLNPKNLLKAGSEEHLNVVFGWLPIFSDLRSIHSSLQNAQKIIDQLDRDSGKMVRRGWKFKPEVTSDITAVSADRYGPWTDGSSSLMFSQSKPPRGQVMRESKTTRTRWFSGAFTYYVPPVGPNGFTTDQLARKIILAQKVLGAGASPADAWNLLPWSWLVDWFSDIGDFAKNLDAVILDNQVLVYGYMMEHTVSSYTYTLVGPYYYHDNSVGPVPPSVTLVSETKRRISASPYGFGLTLGGLSTLQKSILGALGFTRWLK